MLTYAQPRPIRIRPKRVAAIVIVLSVLLGSLTVAKAADRADAIPDSATCVISAAVLAGATWVTVKSPPTGFWAIAITGGIFVNDIAAAITSCGAWITTPLGHVMGRGHCRQCVSGGGGGGGGGSW